MWNKKNKHKESEILKTKHKQNKKKQHASNYDKYECVCETCYFHLVEYLGNIVKQNKTKSQQLKQQLNNKNKSREEKTKYIFESKELINVKQKKMVTGLFQRPAKSEEEEKLCSVGFIRKQTPYCRSGGRKRD